MKANKLTVNSNSYGPVHMRSKNSNIFAPQESHHIDARPFLRKHSTTQDVHEKTDRMKEQIRLTGCTDYNSRRLLEMYSNSSVLKVATKQANLPHEFKGAKRFDVVAATTMAQELKRKNRADMVVVPSKISTTGWKELAPD